MKGTIEFEILHRNEGITDLIAYTDSDFAWDLNDRKSTSSFVFLLGKGVVLWYSKKQPVVTLSTIEGKYMSAAFCVIQCIWHRNLLKELSHNKEGGSVINCDNSSTI